MVRRFVTLTLSFCLVLGVGILQMGPSFAQDAAKKAAQPAQADTAKKETPKATEPATKEAPKATEKEAPKATEAPLPPIPKEVQDKIDAANKAVAEAIVAAQDAGLVETSIDPPPILDILITGRATDARTLKNTGGKKPYPVSPEVFCAWFTGYGTIDGIDYVHDVRIVNPSAGLKQYFDRRAAILRNAIAEVRKAKGPAPKPAEATKPAEAASRRNPRRPRSRRRPSLPRRWRSRRRTRNAPIRSGPPTGGRSTAGFARLAHSGRADDPDRGRRLHRGDGLVRIGWITLPILSRPAVPGTGDGARLSRRHLASSSISPVDKTPDPKRGRPP